jgi:hypothetical protein
MASSTVMAGLDPRLSGSLETVVHADFDAIVDPPRPGLSRPSMSSKEAVPTARKAWMAGTSPAKGIWSCVRIATSNRSPSTGQQPWVKPGHDDFYAAFSVAR